MFKTWIKGCGEKSYATNGLEFDTVDDAKNYGNDLLSRWFGAESFEVLPMRVDFQGFLSQEIVDTNKVS